jgi:hypothetical protein
MMHQIEDDVWTPKIVGDCLIDAIKWAQHAAGRTGPAGVRSGMPSLALSSDERAFEEWPSLAEIEEFEEPKVTRRSLSPAKVSQMERILAWPSQYLVDFNKDDNPVSWAVFRAWVRCKLTKGVSFEECCKVNGWSRASAYRLRDHVLSKIAIGLTNDGIYRGKH